MFHGFRSNKIDYKHVKDLPAKTLFVLFLLIVFFSPLVSLSFATYKDQIKLSGQPIIDIWCAYVPAVRYLSCIYCSRLLTERNFMNVMLCRGHMTKEREIEMVAGVNRQWMTCCNTHTHTHSLTCWHFVDFCVLRYWDKSPSYVFGPILSFLSVDNSNYTVYYLALF